MNLGAKAMYLYQSMLIDETGTVANTLSPLKFEERVERFGDLILSGVFKYIEAEQDRYQGLAKTTGENYDELIDCLENLKICIFEGMAK